MKTHVAMVAYHLLVPQHQPRSVFMWAIKILLKQPMHCDQPFEVLPQENAGDAGKKQIEIPIEVVERLVRLHYWT